MPLESLLNPKDLSRSENSRYLISSYSSRQLQSDKVQAMEIVTMPNNTNMSSSNLTQVNTPMSIGNIQPPGQTGAGNNVFNGFYSSGFNSSINNLEASLQWLSETRVPSNSLMTDKNLNCNTTHSMPSHSCCVNRIDNLGMCSPLPGETYRSSCRDGNFQSRPSSLSVNVMDSMQSWFNLQPIQSNQQYSGKFPDQNLNCAQMNLPILEQSDLKQADINITMPDAYFEPHLSSNANKSIGPNLNEINAKIPDVNDVQSSSMKVQNNNFQSTMLPREWKQSSNLQTNYVSSPTFFNSISDSPDHFIYSIPPPTSSYCMPTTDNIASSSNKQQNCYQQSDKHQNTVPQLSCRPNYIDQTSQLKVLGLPSIQQSTERSEKTFYEKTVTIENVMSSSDVMKSIQSSASTQKDNQLKMDSSRKFPDSLANYTLPYLPDVGAPNETIVHSGISQKLPELSKTIEQNLNDDSSSGSDESNIIVEESDETEEMESVTSIEEMKKTLLSSVELRCLVCNVKSSQKTPATQFIHMNDSFPLTSASRTPVASKLIQIIPADLKHFLKLHNSFMCRRCLNLIETVEVLEVKLTSVKQTLSENFSKTIQCFLPATPIIEIEDGKAEIVDKEIIKSIEKSGLEGALVNFSETTLYLDIQPAKPCVTVDRLEEEVDDDDDGIDDDDNDNTNTRDDFAEEGEEVDGDVEKMTCDVCGKTLSSAKTFKRHMELHTGAFSFYCETCGKGFNKKSSLETHLQTHTGENRFQCEKCGQTYSQKHRLETHLRKHAADFSLHCDVCGKGFVQKSLLEKHAMTHTDYRPFVCEICGLTFSKKSGLKAHLDVCEKKEFACDCCSQVFTSQANLKKHKVAEHCDEPPACCEICGKIFAQRKDLKPHMRSHSDDKPFCCEICDKSYKTRGDLNYHSKIHNVDKLFKCSICDKCFSRKQAFDDHMSKHAGNRNYKCTECDKAFFEKGKLQKHMSIHNGGAKRKTCLVCNKEVQHMNVHMRIHSGDKPYVCKFCGLAFRINRTLMRHVQSKHYSSA